LQYQAVVLQKLLTITEKRMALKAMQMAHGQVMRVKSHFFGTYDL
jgi:hypothetical protein